VNTGAVQTVKQGGALKPKKKGGSTKQMWGGSFGKPGGGSAGERQVQEGHSTGGASEMTGGKDKEQSGVVRVSQRGKRGKSTCQRSVSLDYLENGTGGGKKQLWG